MADKVRETSTRIDKSIASGAGGGGVRVDEGERGGGGVGVVHIGGSSLPPPAPRKKTSSFQITSVTVVGSRLSNDGGDDSADDLDESHTEDISSELLDISKMTDADNDYSSEDAFSASIEQTPATTTSVHSVQLAVPNNGQGDASQVPVSSASSVSTEDSHHDRSIPWHTRFRVVKIESTEPFKRGRWICMDFLDPPPSQPESVDREGGSGNSSAASSVHYGESYIEIPIGQEMFYQQTDSQQHVVPVHPQTVVEQHPALLQQQQQQQSQQQQQQQQQQQPQTQQTILQQQQQQQQTIVDFQQQQQLNSQIQAQSLPQQQGVLIPPHHGGSLPMPLSTQQPPAVVQQMNEFYNVPQSGAMTTTQSDYVAASGGGGVLPHQPQQPGEYIMAPSQAPTALHQAEYVHAPAPMSQGMHPTDLQQQQQQQMAPQQIVDYQAHQSSHSEYVPMHPAPPSTEYVHQQTAQIPQQQQQQQQQQPQQQQQQQQQPPPPQQTQIQIPPQQVHQPQSTMVPPPGDYIVHQPGDYMVHQAPPASIPHMVKGTHPQMPAKQPPVSAPQPVLMSDYGGQTQPPPQTALSHPPPTEATYAVPPANSRPSTISIAEEPLASTTITITPPVLDNLGVPSKEGEDAESTSGSSTVAIDNKIEQAMDLVKSHLMFAVREEVDVLKEKITELLDRINQLEYENSVLRAAASQETLAKLTQPPPNPQPPNSSS